MLNKIVEYVHRKNDDAKIKQIEYSYDWLRNMTEYELAEIAIVTSIVRKQMLDAKIFSQEFFENRVYLSDSDTQHLENIRAVLIKHIKKQEKTGDIIWAECCKIWLYTLSIPINKKIHELVILIWDEISKGTKNINNALENMPVNQQYIDWIKDQAVYNPLN